MRRGGGRWSKSIRASLLVVSFAIPAVIVYQTWNQMSRQEWHLRYGFFVLALVLYCVDIGLAVGAWHLLTHRLGAGLRFLQGTRVYCISLAANRLPGGVWGYASRVYLARDDKANPLLTGLAVLLEMLFVLIAGLLLGCLYLLLYRPFSWPWPLYVVIGIAFCAILGASARTLVLWKALRVVLRVLKRGALADHLPLRNGEPLLWIGIYAAVWLVGGLALAVVAKALVPLSLVDVPQAVGVWALASSLSMLVFFIPNGLGVREIGLIFLLQPILPAPVAAATALAMRGLSTFSEVAALSIALVAPRLTHQSSHQLSAFSDQLDPGRRSWPK